MSKYESPAWISGDLDDAGLTHAEFRLVAHVCRRSGNGSNGRWCDSSVPTMAKVCRINEGYTRTLLKRLVDLEWLEVEKRDGTTNVYRPRFPSADPPKNKGYPPGRNKGGGGGRNKGDEGIPSKGCHSSEPSRDSNSAPVGTAFPTGDANSRMPSMEEALEMVKSIHEEARFDPDNSIGMYCWQEVAEWTKQWHFNMKATGGKYKGSDVRDWKAALTGYLRSAANRQSKRMKELNRHCFEDTPPPF